MLVIILFIVFSQVFAQVKIKSLPISTSFEPLEPGTTIVDQDMARFNSQFARHEKRTHNVELKGTGIVHTVNIGVGSPIARYYNLAIDTGSSDTWLEDRLGQVKDMPGPAHRLINTGYFLCGIGVRGDLYVFLMKLKEKANLSEDKDHVQLSSSIIITNMEFGVDISMKNINSNYDGVLGLRFRRQRVRPNNVQYMPTIMDTLVAQHIIQQNVFGLSFEPTTPQGPVIGELNFGGTNEKYAQSINWVPITGKEPWNQYWGFEQVIEVTSSQNNSNINSLLHTEKNLGTTLIYISPQAFEVYSQSLQGSKVAECKLLEIPQASLSQMKPLYFRINEVPYELTPKAQLWPQRLNHLVGGRADRHYSVINTIAGFTSPGLIMPDFIIGYTFMKRFYTGYNQDNSKVGFAYTRSTYAEIF
ncbi:aspartic protease [Rhizoctonia solani AG-3 Rhs1AP]|uniref:Aspartic protease n=1 Tax=Rhizoctonia solani AG-3 Rhs1AP TaxID=1086054 RepID=X8JSL8_9AGAM|nr:aspartic protease [Rhizoctonia solani AG-3 Rhs1AP]